jgi:hypothetical protein
MRKLILLLALWATTTALAAEPARWARHLPKHARIVQTAALATAHGRRLLVLWVAGAKETRGEGSDYDALTCPEMAMGRHYLYGRARLSLVNRSGTGFANSVLLNETDFEQPIVIPLHTKNTLYDTHADCSSDKPPLCPAPGTPPDRVMRMRDINGDGLPYEFALFETESCSDLYAAIVGYSQRRDAVIWYRFHLLVNDEGQLGLYDEDWISVMFLDTAPVNGVWRFTMQYPEDPPREYRYVIRYDAEHERFVGVENIVRTR